jgi:predicted nuclease of predicted toxin-antitoxin system
MKLLLDHNLSFKLVDYLPNQFKGSSHVHLLDHSNADDTVIWELAKENNFTIVTKDTDFFDLISLKGYPPKVIWIKRGNCSTREVLEILNENHPRIVDFIGDKDNGILILK